ncbi:unnamed protein product [Ilex paraguariensis]|uniref:Uncharacterized protein n=1 Tax=Ilex paraguariensis TaxID=185542 RepID=A0ABC8RXS8_9AQUA
MDHSPETNDKISPHYLLLRCTVALLFSLFAFLLLSFTLVLVSFSIGDVSISRPISVPSLCKIVSSTVDLRSSKVCELGLLNYKAKHVVYPSEGKKLRCWFDYYWASIFQVEYVDNSGQAQMAFAEAPNEALPPDCRPNFGVAWLTKDKFKVNESYDCWYTLGLSKVNIYHDSFFDCQAKDPSATEMLKRHTMLSTRILMSWFATGSRARHWICEAMLGVLAGILTPLIFLCLFKLLQQVKSLPRMKAVRMLFHLKRACFFVAYFSFVGWLAIQYGKRLGLSEIFKIH